MQRVLVTGASGFIGKALVESLEGKKCTVVKAVRQVKQDSATEAGGNIFGVGDLGPDSVWDPVLEGVDAVVHLAGRAHVLRETASNPLTEFRRVNVLGTQGLARAAVRAGVKRLVFVSSVGVNGSISGERPFREQDVPAPHNAYALSKLEAEKTLWRIAADSGLEVVVVRPPLVYGPGVKANFLRLLQWVDKGIPLPLGAVKNRRSLVALENLVDFLDRCARDPAAAGQVFFVADGEDLSTPDLIRTIATAMKRPGSLWPVPIVLLSGIARMLRKQSMIDSLCGSLQVDIGKAKKLLRWEPRVSVQKALEKTVFWYLENKVAGGRPPSAGLDSGD